ncbi:hypothetical protein RUM43_004198 [Polyplax serrata]|uniref:Uncharacterized protein n=1 Tax=Polyplax serrata TaxID=468196 RepID=A0AAN8SAM2_POLSC
MAEATFSTESVKKRKTRLPIAKRKHKNEFVIQSSLCVIDKNVSYMKFVLEGCVLEGGIFRGFHSSPQKYYIIVRETLLTEHVLREIRVMVAEVAARFCKLISA